MARFLLDPTPVIWHDSCMELVFLWTLAGVALAGSLLALWRSVIPPQRKDLYELTGRVEALELRSGQLGDMIVKEQRRVLAEAARAAKAAKALGKEEQLAADAREVLAAAAASSVQPARPAPTATREEMKAELARRWARGV
jgi:hypothetical protein